MNKIFSSTMLFLGLFGTEITAQEYTMSGKIVDAEQGTGIPGVTLQLAKSGRQSTTNVNGYFNWKPGNVLPEDSVYVSCMGYFPIGRTVKEMKENTWMLSPRNYTLKEVTLSQRKLSTKWLNSFKIRQYGERDRIPDLGERQTDMVGRPFVDEKSNKFTRIRSVQILQEGFQTKDLSTWRQNQHWRFRLRIVKAGIDGLPTDQDLLKQRVILTVSDVKYQYYDPGRYDERTNSTKYTNWDYTERVLFGVIDIDLRRYEVPYPKSGVFVFVELLPPLIIGGDRIFKLAKLDVGNSGWFRNGRTKQWSRGVHWVMQPDGKETDQNIEPAIALELME
jgi:hypothetical protein